MKQGTVAYAKREQLVAAARTYKAEGHTYKEVAERFGKSRAWVEKYCKGIAPQTYLRGNQFTNGSFDQVENARRIIAKHYPNFEYVRGFTNVDSPVTIRCKLCGTEKTASMISLRRDNSVACKECKRREREKAAEKDLSNKAIRVQVLKAQRFNQGVQVSMWFCEACGVASIKGMGRGNTRRFCETCAAARERKYHNVKKERRRLSAMTAESGNITARALYERDGGVCWLCGGMCNIDADTNDNDYPSVDHIKPISLGGKDSWDNVRLAHRLCNSLRFNHEKVMEIPRKGVPLGPQ